MEVTKVLDVTLDEMDVFVADMVVRDIKEATNRKITAEKIHPGYTYTKKLTGRNGKEGKVTTVIKELKSGCYHVTFKSAQGVNHLMYQYHSVNDDQQIELTYSETFESQGMTSSLNFRLMNFFYKHSSKRRIEKILYNIEVLINENRKVED